LLQLKGDFVFSSIVTTNIWLQIMCKLLTNTQGNVSKLECSWWNSLSNHRSCIFSETKLPHLCDITEKWNS